MILLYIIGAWCLLSVIALPFALALGRAAAIGDRQIQDAFAHMKPLAGARRRIVFRRNTGKSARQTGYGWYVAPVASMQTSRATRFASR